MLKLKLSLLFALLFAVVVSANAALKVHVIDVGHGDAIFLEEDGKGIALIDAGKPEYGMFVQQYIKDLGIDNLELLCVTHTHKDHVGGVPDVLDNLNVATICHTGMMQDWEEAVRFNSYLDKALWPAEIVFAGSVIYDDGNLTMEVLSPPDGDALQPDCDANGNSMVLLVTYQNVKFLLPADVNGEAESSLVETYGDLLQCQVLKASHHASKPSNQLEFLQAVKPEIAVITVGPNDWGYPDDTTIARLKQFVPRVFRTDQDGTVIIETDGQSISIVKP